MSIFFAFILWFAAGLTPPAAPTPPSSPAPIEAPKPPAPDVCQSLTKPAHIALAKRLSGNERILFCSIFDDTQRDQVLSYMQGKPPLDPKDAVIQVGKDNNLLFSSQPGGACGAH